MRVFATDSSKAVFANGIEKLLRAYKGPVDSRSLAIIERRFGIASNVAREVLIAQRSIKPVDRGRASTAPRTRRGKLEATRLAVGSRR
jgi:hypothetical protein